MAGVVAVVAQQNLLLVRDLQAYIATQGIKCSNRGFFLSWQRRHRAQVATAATGQDEDRSERV